MFHNSKEWPAWLAPALVFVLTVICGLFGALSMSGCGGGGGGGNPPPNREHRSVNAVGNNVSTTVGSRFHKTVTLFWVGDNTGTNYGIAKIESFAKTAGTGDLTLNAADGTLDLANDLANDTFRFTFSARHPVGTGDPEENQIENGTAAVVITPQDPRINPLSTLTIPQGSSVNLAAEAQNSRVAGSYKLVRASSSRVFVGTSASWSVSPANAGSFGSNPAEVGSFQASPSFAGDATITATILGSNERVTAVVHIIPHPSVAISSPTEGQEVSGTIAVQFTATNANTVTYRVDGGSDTPVGGSSFQLNTTTLTNGSHSITMKATGQLETATLVRTFTVNNVTDPGNDQPGHAEVSNQLSGTPGTSVNSDVGTFSTGGSWTISAGGLIRIFSGPNATGTVLYTLDLATPTYTADTAGDTLWVPCDNQGVTRVFNKLLGVVQTLTTGNITKASFCQQNGKMYLAGPSGLLEYDATTFSLLRQIRSAYTVSAACNGRYIVYQDGTNQLYRIDSDPGNPGTPLGLGQYGLLYDLYCTSGVDLILGTDRDNMVVRQIKFDGTAAGPNLALPNGSQVRGIGVNRSDVTGRSISVIPSPERGHYLGTIVTP